MMKNELRLKIAKLQNKRDRLQNKIHSLDSRITELELELQEGWLPEYCGPGVYVIESHGFYKIGRANDVFNRLATLQTGNPRLLRVVGYVRCCDEKEAFELEKKLHAKLAYYRRRGEWFDLDRDNLEYLRKVCSQKLNGHLLQVLFDYRLMGDDEKEAPADLVLNKVLRDKTGVIMTIIRDLQKESGGPAPRESVVSRAESAGISRERATAIIERMRRDGTLFEPRSGMLRFP